MGNQFETSDLAIAAYLSVNGLKLVEAGFRNGRKGSHFYRFDDPENRAPGLVVAFANSPESKFDACVRSLKKLVYESRSQLR